MKLSCELDLDKKFTGPLIPGRAYLWKNTSIGLFLGKTINDEYAFYALTSISLSTCWRNQLMWRTKAEVIHPDIQIPRVKHEIKAIMERPIDPNLVHAWINVPTLLCEWYDCHDLFNFDAIVKQNIDAFKKCGLNPNALYAHLAKVLKSPTPGVLYADEAGNPMMFLGNTDSSYAFYRLGVTNNWDAFAFASNPMEYMTSERKALGRAKVTPFIVRSKDGNKLIKYDDITNMTNRFYGFHASLPDSAKKLCGI